MSVCLDVTGRALMPADAPAAAALHEAASDDPWPTEAWAILIGDSLTIAEGILIGGRLAAAALLRSVADEAEILMLLVDRGHRRQGFASRLLTKVLTEGHQRGAGRAFLEVDVANIGARALYRRFGFVDVGRRKGYYSTMAGPRDALILSRTLPLDDRGRADGDANRNR